MIITCRHGGVADFAEDEVLVEQKYALVFSVSFRSIIRMR